MESLHSLHHRCHLLRRALGAESAVRQQCEKRPETLPSLREDVSNRLIESVRLSSSELLYLLAYNVDQLVNLLINIHFLLFLDT